MSEKALCSECEKREADPRCVVGEDVLCINCLREAVEDLDWKAISRPLAGLEEALYHAGALSDAVMDAESDREDQSWTMVAEKLYHEIADAFIPLAVERLNRERETIKDAGVPASSDSRA